MKAMKIISYVICGIVILGSISLISSGDISTGMLGILIYVYFLIFAINVKA